MVGCVLSFREWVQCGMRFIFRANFRATSKAKHQAGFPGAALLRPAAQAGVSSKGYGACISVGGAVYLKDDGWKIFFASCDLKSYLAVNRSVERRRAGTSAVATMPAGTSKAAFVVHRVGSGQPPTLRLTGPAGRAGG